MFDFVKSLLGGNRNSEESSRLGYNESHGDPHSLPAASSRRRSAHAHRAYGPEETSLMAGTETGQYKFFSDSVSSLLADSPEHAVEITSDDDSQPKRRATSLQETPPTVPPRLRLEDRSQSPVAGARNLGRPTTNTKYDPEPTLIPDPMMIDKELRRKNLMAGTLLRPIDTLRNPLTRSAKSRSQLNHHRENVYLHRDRKVTKERKLEIRRDSEHRPVKKQRIGPSPSDGNKQSPIELNDSYESVFEGFPDGIQHLPKTPLSPRSRLKQDNQLPQVLMPAATQITSLNSPSPSLQSRLTAGSQESERPADIHGSLSGTRHPEVGRSVHEKSRRSFKESDNTTGAQYVESSSASRSVSAPVSSRLSLPQRGAHIRFDDGGKQMASSESHVVDRETEAEADSPDPIQQSGTNQRPEHRTARSSSSSLARPALNKTTAEAAKKRKWITPESKTRSLGASKNDNITAFNVKDIAGYYVPQMQDYYCFYIDYDDGKFWLHLQDPTIDSGPATNPREIDKIQSIMHGKSGPKLFLRLSKSHDIAGNNFVMELESHKQAMELVSSVQHVNTDVTVAVQPDEVLNDIFKNKKKEGQQLQRKTFLKPISRQENADDSRAVKSPYFKEVAPKPARTKVTNAFDPPSRRSMNQPVSEQKDRGSGVRQILGELDVQALEDTQTGDQLSERLVRARPFRPTTRSETAAERSPPRLSLKYSQRIGLGEKWSHDLVYPPHGKKRESVQWSDLFRLDEDEFLNDTLIAFFARYVQQEVEVHEPALLKKMHFFNTYFFDALTKNVKGRRGINHSGVSRWTKTIDIFSRDFVVVPVNDNLHWYLAIICNLTYFVKKERETGSYGIDDDRDDHDEAENSVISPTSGTLQENDHEDTEQGQRTTRAQESFQEMSLDDRENEASISQTTQKPSAQLGNEFSPNKARHGKQRKSKPRRSLPKYETDIPIIITLDSLGQPRSATISALKEYIIQEAKEKRNIVVDRDEIRGMTAKGVPSQANYSDCGLYMCMYLEQFMKDPYGFVRKILRREEGDLRWPQNIRGERLRSRLRHLILELYHRQESGEKKRDIPPLGKIMVEMRESNQEVEQQTSSRPSRSGTDSPKIGDQRRHNFEHARRMIQEVDELQVTGVGVGVQDSILRDRDDHAPSCLSQKRDLDEALRQVEHDPHSRPDNPLIIDSPGGKANKRPKRASDTFSCSSPGSSKHVPKTQSPMFARSEVKTTPTGVSGHSSSGQLADQLRAVVDKAAAQTGKISTSARRRHTRSDSTNMNFLQGLESYAKADRDDDYPREFKSNLTTASLPIDLALEPQQGDEIQSSGDDAGEAEVAETQEADIDDEGSRGPAEDTKDMVSEEVSWTKARKHNANAAVAGLRTSLRNQQGSANEMRVEDENAGEMESLDGSQEVMLV